MKKQTLSKENLRTLIDRSGQTFGSIAKETGISENSIEKYLMGENPSVSTLCRLCDFFGVSADYLLGRSSTEDVSELFHRYSELRRMVLEDDYPGRTLSELKAIGKRKIIEKEETILTWPYNLIYDAYIDVVIPLTSDQEEGLKEALGNITEREKAFIELYYKDGYTSGEIGRKYEITANRVIQVIHHALRKLRSKANKSLIQYGLRGSGVLQRQNRLNKIEKRLDQAEKDIRARQEQLWEMKQDTECPGADISIDELRHVKPISVRLYNCLFKSNLKSLKAIIRFIVENAEYPENPMFLIRNIGVKTVYEFDDMLYGYTGYHTQELQKLARKIDKDDKKKNEMILKMINDKQMNKFISTMFD